MDYQKLFNYMSEEHGVTLLEQDMQEICNIVNEIHNHVCMEFDMNTIECDSVCSKCKFEPMIKVDEKYNCEMCGYVAEFDAQGNLNLKKEEYSTCKDSMLLLNFIYKMNSKLYKKIARRLRSRPQTQPKLCNVLINVRSWYPSSSMINHQLKPILWNKALERESAIKMAVIEKFGSLCFFSYPTTHKEGHKTYFKEGKYYDHKPFDDDIDF